jgi:hypothetical protein
VSQNSQPWGIITLHAGAAVGAEMLLRSARHPATGADAATVHLERGAPWLLAAFLVPTVLHCLMALVLHAGVALAKAGEPLGLPKFEDIRLAVLWSPGDYDFLKAYLDTIRAGAATLSDLETEPARVSVLDFVSPFSAGLGLPPASGDFSWLHWGRNVDEKNHLPPEQLFAGVDILMVPTWGINTLPLQGVYADYIDRAFEPVRRTPAWTLHVRRTQAAGRP